MRSVIQCILMMVVFMWATPVSATILFSCDFEQNGQTCLTGIAGNRIATFSQLGIPALPGGGSYAVTAKNKKDTNSEDLDFYYREHGTQNLYGRVYVFFPQGWHAGGSFSNGLKFWGATSNTKIGKCAECVWTTIWWKIAEQSGEIWLAPQHSREPVLSQGGRVNKPLTRGEWHYVEFHLKNNPNGPDLVETWIDADARSSAPTHQFIWELFPVTTDKFGIVDMNINWSGFVPSWVQEYYVDGLVTANTPIGDTYGLLGSQEEERFPDIPTNVRVQ